MDYEIKKCSVLDAGADIIVNVANNELQAGGGVCGAIFAKAGYEELQEECNNIGTIQTGDVAMTKGYKSGAQFIIHAVGPNMWKDRLGWQGKLMSVYWKSLELAEKTGLSTIAFPCISTGIFGCPLEECSKIAINTVSCFCASNLKKVIFCCFRDEEYDVYMNYSNKRSDN